MEISLVFKYLQSVGLFFKMKFHLFIVQKLSWRAQNLNINLVSLRMCVKESRINPTKLYGIIFPKFHGKLINNSAFILFGQSK